ncbi:MAG: polyprenyl diphosphate synthase [bacterium]
MLRSIAFIPDGNRRHASAEGISFTQSYIEGTRKAWEVLSWLSKYPTIDTVIFYTLSLKNLERPKTELMILLKIFEQELDKVMKRNEVIEEGINIRFIGRRDVFSKGFQTRMEKIEKYTEQFRNKQVIIAIGYDGQTEIVDAVKKYTAEFEQGLVNPNELTVDELKRYLYVDFKSPDLIVRTSKEQRLSGFLTFQSAYSEFAFLDKKWPEITEQDVDAVIAEYETRHRRFGK